MPTQQESNSSVLAELYKYNPSALIELYELDLTPLQEYYTSKGAPIATTKYYFHNGKSQNLGNIIWGASAQTYNALPIEIDGVQASSAGEVPRPSLTVGNIDLFFTQLCRAYANLVGAKITRIRTFVKFLNSANFETRNLLLNTEAFNTWLALGIVGTTTNATTAPNGTLTADKIYEGASVSPDQGHGVYRIITGVPDNTKVCFSVYLKAAERQYVTLGVQDKNTTATIHGKTFDLVNGTISSLTRNSVLNAGITPVGNGWYRCWVVVNSATGTSSVTTRIYLDNDNNPNGLVYAGTLNSGAYAWGAQAEYITNPTNTPSIYQEVGTVAGNPTADPAAKFPDDTYTIDRMAEEVPGQITFDLAPAWDVEGVMLPRRQIVANVCPWVYKKDACTWSTSGAATANGPTGTSGAVATFAGTIAAQTADLVVTSVTAGTLRPNMVLTGTSLVADTKIVNQLDGPTGGAGTYSVSKAQTVLATVTGATTVGTFTNVPGFSSVGSGIKFTVVVTAANASYSTATITVTAPGTGYTPSQTVAINGFSLGGTAGTNNMTVTIGSLNAAAYYDANDTQVFTLAEDSCGKRLNSCRKRFGSRILPFGGFPSAGLYGKPI